MTGVKAVIFDFIGTLTELIGYSLEDANNKLYRSLVSNGYNANQENFLEAYDKAHQKYHEIRYGQHVEVTNAVWVSEALNNLGYTTTLQDEEIKTAVNVFFEDYVRALKLRPFAKSILRRLSQNYELGLISNFTYAPVIFGGLRKLNINGFFDAVLVSEMVGWRKPNPRIFQEALQKLCVASKEAVFVGDSPIEDMYGAKRAGMKTVFIPSQFNSLEDLKYASQKPDHAVEDLREILRILS